MNAKHTPGPWSIGNYKPEGITQDCIYSADGVRVATMESWKGDAGSETDANAHLIAAAPGLLVAAQCAYTILADIRHQWAGRHTEEGQGTLVALREAIAQATGRDPQDVQDEYTNAQVAKAKGEA